MNYQKKDMDRSEIKSKAVISFEQWASQLLMFSSTSNQSNRGKLDFLYRLFNDYNQEELGRDAVENLLQEFPDFFPGNNWRNSRDYIEAALKRAGKTSGESIDHDSFVSACIRPVEGNPLHLNNIMYIRLFRPGLQPVFEVCCFGSGNGGFESSQNISTASAASNVSLNM
jgi:hypothetical protein